MRFTLDSGILVQRLGEGQRWARCKKAKQVWWQSRCAHTSVDINVSLAAVHLLLLLLFEIKVKKGIM